MKEDRKGVQKALTIVTTTTTLGSLMGGIVGAGIGAIVGGSFVLISKAVEKNDEEKQ